MEPSLASLARVIADAPFRTGVFVRDTQAAVLLSVDPDGVYPAASVIKVPLTMTLYDDAAAGRLDLGERVGVGERMDGSGVIRDLRDVDTMTLRDLAALTMILSDNTATNALIDRVGAARVAERLASWGCTATHLRRRMYDFEAAKRGLENVATAREMAGLAVRMVNADGISHEAADAVLALMARCADDQKLRRYLAADADVPNKSGTLERSRNDVGVFRGPRATLVAAMFTAEVDDPLRAEHLLGLVGRAVAEAVGMPLPALPFA